MKRSHVILSLAATTAGVVGVAQPAAANTGGFNNNNAWSDEVTLGQSTGVSSGNVVGMWQEHLRKSFGLPGSETDGYFGPDTRDRTKFYQHLFDITADGIVGPQTWDVARFITGAPTGGGCSNSQCFYTYQNSNTALNVDYLRYTSAGGTWKYQGCVEGPSTAGGWIPTDYYTPTFSHIPPGTCPT